MARQPSQLTKEIQYAIKEGLTNKEIAELLTCTTQKVASVRHRDKAKSKSKQREYNRRYKARKKQMAQHNAITEVTDDEINALRNVPNPTMPITLESRGKYSLWERVRILFRGW